MGIETADTINQPRNARAFNIAEIINGTELPSLEKTKLLIEIANKRKTVLQGAMFMLNHKSLKFDDFERSLASLKTANNSYSLGAVEGALQAQINVILRMSEVDLSRKEKALCLYSLQNMIFGLRDFQLHNGKDNDYVPRLLQDQYQVLIKGSSQNMDWDQLNESCYSTEYYDLSNPVLANFKFLDLNRIKKNEKLLSQKHTVETTQTVDMTKKQSIPMSNDGVITWGMLELEKTTDVEINQVLNKALAKFDAKNLKDNLPELFNFVKETLESQSKDQTAIDYKILNEIVVASMHRIVEIGSGQQRKAILEQENLEGRLR